MGTRHTPRWSAAALLTCAALGGCGTPAANVAGPAAAQMRSEISTAAAAASRHDWSAAGQGLSALEASVTRQRAQGHLTAGQFQALDTGIAQARAQLRRAQSASAPTAPVPSGAAPSAAQAAPPSDAGNAQGNGNGNGSGKGKGKDKGNGGGGDGGGGGGGD